MPDLTELESDAADRVSSALNCVAELLAAGRDDAVAVRTAIADGLDAPGRELLLNLAAIVEANRFTPTDR